MPRMALEETLAAVCIGRPMPCLDPAPITSIGVLEACASASTRANSRSSMGRMCEKTDTGGSRSGAGGLTAVEGKHLGRVQEPLGVEHCLDAHLLGQVGLVELHGH